MPVGSILASLTKSCAPTSSVGRWSFSVPRCDAVQAPGNRTDLLESLVAEHSLDAVIAAGVARHTDAGLVFCEGLNNTARPLLILREDVNADPYALLTELGTIPTSSSPVTAVLGDVVTGNCLEQFRRIFLCASMEDAVVLRTVGLAAMTCAGMHEMTIEQWTELSLACHWTSDEPGASLQPIELALVGWSPAQFSLERPALIEALAKQWLECEWHGTANLQHVGIWLPSPNDRAQLNYSSTCKAYDQVVDALRSSATASVFLLGAVDDEPGPTPDHPGYRLARQRLITALAAAPGEVDPVRIAELRRSFDLAVEDERVAPLLERALAEDDEHLRTAGILFAEASGDLHRHFPLVGRTPESLSVSDLSKRLSAWQNLFKDVRR